MGIPTKGRILIVDDELVVRESLLRWFKSEGYESYAAASAREALEVADHNWDLALVDIKMPGMDGLELQERLKEADPDLVIIIMTGYASVETAVQALKHGAYDYLAKPVDPDALVHMVQKALEHRRTRRDVARLQETLSAVFPNSTLVAKSPGMKSVLDMIEVVAPSEATVLITGESGTGKEVVARAIHAGSPRHLMPLVTIHCGALSETLLESELFGHERGAFTGAQFRKKGKFEVADGGTVFLDEIGDISLKTQSDLMRVLQEKEIVRVGSTQPFHVDFRCIAATNKDLEPLIEAHTFRSDLYYRLKVVSLHLPPLRERREDIMPLANAFLKRFVAQANRPIRGFTPEAVDRITGFEWPGNVRQLQNEVQRAVLLCEGGDIDSTDLSITSVPTDTEGVHDTNFTLLEGVERNAIVQMLRETGGNKLETAKRLGIGRQTLYNKIKAYGIEV